MIRHCDGTDPNLIRPDDILTSTYVPCACGLKFDDVDRSVVHPHTEFGAAKAAFLAFVLGDDVR